MGEDNDRLPLGVSSDNDGDADIRCRSAADGGGITLPVEQTDARYSDTSCVFRKCNLRIAALEQALRRAREGLATLPIMTPVTLLAEIDTLLEEKL